MLFFFLLVYVIIAEFVLVICHRWVGCRLRVPIRTVDAGGSVGVEVQTVSPGAWTGPRLKFVFIVRNTFTGETLRIRRKMGKSKGKEVVYPFLLTLPEAGNYEITLQSVRFYDRMGLLSFKMKLKGQTQSVQVLPKLSEVPVRVSQQVRRFYGESDIYDEEREGSDSSQPFGVRPFAQGDKLQKIHWKLSARTDEWMVRQDSQPKACAVVVLLDYGMESGRRRRRRKSVLEQTPNLADKQKKQKKQKNQKKRPGKYTVSGEQNINSDDKRNSAKRESEKREAQNKLNKKRMKEIAGSGAYLEMAGSISYTLMDQDCPHYMVWYDEKNRDITRIRVDDEESFYLFLTQYLAGQGANPPESLMTMYQEKYKSEHYLHSLRLTQEMEVYKDEERIFQPRDGEWNQVEILL